MSLDRKLWERLQEHGVSEAHLEMLLQVLQTQRNGSWTWHIVHGSLSQCDLRLTMPARSYEVQRVCETVLMDGASVVR